MKLAIAAALGLALFAGAAHAKCDPALGWPAGKQCQDADRVGVRISGQDKSLQAALDDGTLPSTIQAGAAPQTVTLANLPTCNAALEGARRIVSDALSDLACTTGGGSANAPAVCRNSAWTCELAATTLLGAIADQANGNAGACDAALGICPNPRSTLLLDTRILFAVARGGVRDDDGSMYGGSPAANDVFDFINNSTLISVNSGGTPYVFVASSANALDTLVCRDNVSFAPCSTGASCVSNMQSIADPLPWVWCDGVTGRCEAFGAAATTNCNSSSESLTGYPGRSSLTNAGTIQLAMPDGVHPSSQLSKLIAQSILAAAVELVEFPVSAATNLIANGDATSAATGWDEIGSGTVAHDVAEAIPADPQNGNFYNGGIQLSGRAAAADSLRTPAMAVEAGRWYVARGFARVNAVSTERLIVRAVDAGSNTPHATQASYQVHGSWYEPLTSSQTSRDRQCYVGCYFIVKFLVPSGTSSTRIEIATDSGTANIHADDWIGMPAPTERLGLTPLFPSNGGVALRVEGDSRANDANDLADAIDDAVAAGVPRASFELLDLVFPNNTNATGGRSADNMVTSEALSSVTFSSSGGRYVVVFLGVNDVGSQTPAAIAADYQAIARKIRQEGGRPFFVLEPPYRGNTNTTTCEASSENCTTTIDELADLMKHSTTGALHQ